MRNKTFKYGLGALALAITLILIAIITKSVIAVTLPAPQITGIYPASGTVDGNTPVTIRGLNFDQLQSVAFDGSPATITSTTPTVINVITSAHSSGPVIIEISANGYITSSKTAYTYIEPPEHKSVSVDDQCAKINKVAVCHLQPGDIENVHTLCLPEAGVKDHLVHGDYLGICEEGTTGQAGVIPG